MNEKLRRELDKCGNLQLHGRIYAESGDGCGVEEHLYTITCVNEIFGYKEYRMYSDRCCISKTSEEVYAMLNDAMILILSKTGIKTLILEDNSQIKRVEKKDVIGKLIIEDFRSEYSDDYYKTVKAMGDARKFCRSEHFYPKITKKQNGLTLEEAFRYLKDNPDEFLVKVKTDTSDPVLSISVPDITKKYGSQSKTPFDQVAVEVVLRSDLSGQEIKAYIGANSKTLKGRVLEKIGSAKNYQKYNIPTNCLTLSSAKMQGKWILRMVYELKTVEDINRLKHNINKQVSA